MRRARSRCATALIGLTALACAADVAQPPAPPPTGRLVVSSTHISRTAPRFTLSGPGRAGTKYMLDWGGNGLTIVIDSLALGTYTLAWDTAYVATLVPYVGFGTYLAPQPNPRVITLSRERLVDTVDAPYRQINGGIEVRVGAPAGIVTSGRLLRPDGTAAAIERSPEYLVLLPGTYTVVFDDVTVFENGVPRRYVPDPATSTIAVTAGRYELLRVTYR